MHILTVLEPYSSTSIGNVGTLFQCATCNGTDKQEQDHYAYECHSYFLVYT